MPEALGLLAPLGCLPLRVARPIGVAYPLGLLAPLGCLPLGIARLVGVPLGVSNRSFNDSGEVWSL